jgi:uncharacterized tellurite resistance protein B-like protein
LAGNPGAHMLATLKALFASSPAEAKRTDSFGDADLRLAAAALLLRVATAESAKLANKRANLHAVIKRRFRLDDATATRLIEQASEADRHAIDLYAFTSRISRCVDHDGRRRIIEMMWEIVHVGGAVGDLEQNFVWRAADLLGVPSRERIALRRRVAARNADGNAAFPALSTAAI